MRLLTSGKVEEMMIKKCCDRLKGATYGGELMLSSLSPLDADGIYGGNGDSIVLVLMRVQLSLPPRWLVRW